MWSKFSEYIWFIFPLVQCTFCIVQKYSPSLDGVSYEANNYGSEGSAEPPKLTQGFNSFRENGNLFNNGHTERFEFFNRPFSESASHFRHGMDDSQSFLASDKSAYSKDLNFDFDYGESYISRTEPSWKENTVRDLRLQSYHGLATDSPLRDGGNSAPYVYHMHHTHSDDIHQNAHESALKEGPRSTVFSYNERQTQPDERYYAPLALPNKANLYSPQRTPVPPYSVAPSPWVDSSPQNYVKKLMTSKIFPPRVKKYKSNSSPIGRSNAKTSYNNNLRSIVYSNAPSSGYQKRYVDASADISHASNRQQYLPDKKTPVSYIANRPSYTEYSTTRSNAGYAKSREKESVNGGTKHLAASHSSSTLASSFRNPYAPDPCATLPEGDYVLDEQFATLFPHANPACSFVKCANYRAYYNPCSIGTMNFGDENGYCEALDLLGECGYSVSRGKRTDHFGKNYGELEMYGN